MQTQLSLTTVYDVIDYINQNAKTIVERGTWWEKAVVFYLRHDPEMRQVMGDVRLWADAPTNDGHDTGIDVVCEYDGSTPDGSKRYWAVQCKNFDPNHKMDYKELSTFWAKAEADPRYAGYAIVSASEFSKTAIALFSNGFKVSDVVTTMGDVHHIFPKKFLRTELNAPQRLYNQVANYAFLEKKINIAIGAKRPGDYFTTALDGCRNGSAYFGDISDEGDLMANLSANCIPSDVFEMGADDYQRFLEERRQMMAQKIKAYFQSL